MIGIGLLAGGATVGGLAGSMEVGAAAAMIGAWFAGPRVRRRTGPPDDGAHPVVIAAVVAVGAVLLGLSFWRPAAGFDAWAIWSLKAKAIASTGDFGSPVFTGDVYEYSHRDYPPLLPAWQATAYRLSGDLRRAWPTQFQLAWLWTAGGLALAGLAGHRRGLTGFLMIAWMLAPRVVGETMSGYADVPMALFLVAGVAALVRSNELGAAPAAVLLAAAALTKTEGLVFAGAVLVPLIAFKHHRRAAIVASATIALAFLPWAAFAVGHGIAADVARPPPGAEHVADERDVVARVPTVLASFTSESVDPADWGILVPTALVMVAAGIPRRPVSPLVWGFLLASAGLVVIYLLTPYDLAWHLSRSADRVVIAPLGLLALAAAGAPSTRVASDQGNE
jgi:hypothetical protein